MSVIRKRSNRIFLPIVWLALFSTSCSQADMDVVKWQEDIGFYSRELSVSHIDAFHTLSQASFFTEAEKISESVPEKTTSQILVDLMRLTHKINDGHTSFPLWGWANAHYPLGLKLYKDDVYVVSTTTQLKDLLGSRLLFINGVAAADVTRLVSELTPFTENDFSRAVRTAQYLPYASVLNGLGIVQDINAAEFVFDVDGKAVRHVLEAQQMPQLDVQISHLNDTLFSAIKKVNGDLWFGASADKKTVYIKFRRYTSSVRMEALAKNALSFINRNQSANLIIDLRDNVGGDFFVGLKLAQFLVLADSIDWKSGVYVLIDHVTFSAAMSNGAQFAQILNAQLIGTPTGAKPSGYQDMGQFVLPNSGLEVTYSKRMYHFTEDRRDALYPMVNIDVSIDDVINGYDSQLRWVLNHIGDTTNSKPTRHLMNGSESAGVDQRIENKDQR